MNEPDVQRKTPLHYAAERGHMETVAYLIQQRADLEMRNGTGQTPLMSAAHRGQSEVIDLLLLNSADPNAESDHGFLPLHRAAAAGHEDTVRVLLKGRANPLAIDGRRKSRMRKRDSVRHHDVHTDVGMTRASRLIRFCPNATCSRFHDGEPHAPGGARRPRRRRADADGLGTAP